MVDPFDGSGGARTTLRQLATFSAGMPREACVPISAARALGVPRRLYRRVKRAVQGADATYVACGLLAGADAQLSISTTSAASLVVLPGGAVSAYTNFGFALLGEALSRAINSRVVSDRTGVRMTGGIRQYFAERIAAPLGLASTSFNVTPDLAARFAWSTASPSNDYLRFADIGWTAPAGQVLSTADDMSAFYQYLGLASDPATFKLAREPASRRH